MIVIATRVILVLLIVSSIFLVTLLCIPKAKAATLPDQAGADIIAPMLDVYRYFAPGAFGSSLIVDFASGFYDGTNLTGGANQLVASFYDSSSVMITDTFTTIHSMKFSTSLFVPCLTATEENRYASAQYVSSLFPDIALYSQPSPNDNYSIELFVDYMEYNEVGNTYYVQNYLVSSGRITASDLSMDGGNFTPYINGLIGDFFVSKSSSRPSYIVNIAVRINDVHSGEYLVTYSQTEELAINPVDEYYEILGYETGYDDGLEYGKEVGYLSGYVAGEEDGYNEGYQDGKDSVNSFNPIVWLLRALDAVFEFNVIRIGAFALSVGDIIGVSLLVPLLLWFLKLFAGG